MAILSEKKKILGVGFIPDSQEQILEYVSEKVTKGGQKVTIFTPNPEMLILARRDSHFKTVLNSATVALPDGIGVVMASKLFGKGIKVRITGVDFMKSLIERVSDDMPKTAKRQASIGFIGGRKKVAERTAVCLEKKFKNTTFFVFDRDFDAKNFTFRMQDFKELKDGELKDSHPKKLDLLFVAFGFPLQEKWINANLPHIPVTVAMGVGGAFDIISGDVKRAPRILQKSGLEWSWRLGRQPWRIKRQIKLIQYPYLILRERIAR